MILWVQAHSVFALEKDTQAPNFYLRGLKGNDFFASKIYGENAELGQVVVLSFFATWCIPCRAEAPQLQKLSNSFPEVVFYLVSVKDSEDQVLKWLEAYKIEMDVLMDRYGRTAKKFDVIGLSSTGTEVASLPSLFIIDSTGEILLQHTGYKAGDELEISRILELTQ